MSDSAKIILCPYCGHVQSAAADRCELCGGFFDELSRRVSQQHMGPWFIHDKARPFRPGCSYDVLVRQIQRGKLDPNTILRGPTTRQFWSVARNVPGVAHLLGYCFNCGQHVMPTAAECAKCRTVFSAPDIRDQLGLDPLDPRVLEMAATLAAQQASGVAPPPPSPARATIVEHSAPPARATVIGSSSQASASSAARPASPPPIAIPSQSPALVAQSSWIDSGFDGRADTFIEPMPAARSNNTLIWMLVLINVLLAVVITVYLIFNSE